MKRALLSVIVLILLCSIPASPAFGGVEPSPFFPDISIIQLRLILIGQTFTLPDAILDSLTTIDLRLAFIAQNPQPNPWVTPELTSQGVVAIDRLSAILINPQPEPPLPPDDFAIELISIMDRISAILINPQPEPPLPQDLVAQGFNVLDRISAILINPQPEPPLPQDLVAEGFTVLDRISWVLINPQPEPPMPQDQHAMSISVMYNVAGVMQRTSENGFSQAVLPALNALEELSGHLVDAVVDDQPDRAAAQINAMSHISEQYAGY